MIVLGVRNVKRAPRRCVVCGQPGHDVRNCSRRVEPDEWLELWAQRNREHVKRYYRRHHPLRDYRCTGCDERGHNARTCNVRITLALLRHQRQERKREYAEKKRGVR